MSIDLEQHIARLVADRDYLATFLAEHPGWVRLQAARARPGDLEELHRLSVDVERELAGQPLHTAWRALTSAIAALEEVRAEANAQAASKHAGADADAVRDDTSIVQAPPAVVPGAAPSEPAPPPPLPSSSAAAPPTMREVQRVALSLRGGATPVETRTATIHPGPPDARRNARQPGAAAPRTDDLTDIRGIDRKLAEALIARGIRTFDEIAAFGAADVRTLSAALGLGRRISAENWIEQASMLAARARVRRAEAEAAATRPLPVSAAAPGLDGAVHMTAAAAVALADIGAVPAGEPHIEPPATATDADLPDAIAPAAVETGLPPMIRAAAERIALLAASAPPAPTLPPAIAAPEPPAMPHTDRGSIAAAVERAATAIAAAAAASAVIAPIVATETAATAAPAAPHPPPPIADQPLADASPPAREPEISDEIAKADDAALPVAPTHESAIAPPDDTMAEPPAPPRQADAAEAASPAGAPTLEPDPAEAADETPTLIVLPVSIAPALEQDSQPEPVIEFAPEPPQTVLIEAPPPAISAAEPAPPPPDDLAAIRGIDAATAAGLARLGVTRFADIAAWGPHEVASIGQALAPAARISGDGWIEQAAVLARGQATAYARLYRAQALPLLAPHPPNPPVRDPAFALWLARQTSALPIPRSVRAPTPATAPTAPVEPADASSAAPAQDPAATVAITAAPAEAAGVEHAGEVQGTPRDAIAPQLAASVAEEAAFAPADVQDALSLTPPPLPASASAPSGTEERHHPVPHPMAASVLPETPPPALTSPLQSISERMQAIERDLATLDILPIAPARPRRMAQPAAEPANCDAAGAAPDPDLVPTEITAPPPFELPADDDEPFFDLTARRPDEAAVTIIRRAAHEIGLDPLPPPPPSPARAVEPEFDRAEYAAYRERVEEAMVEIVRPGSRPSPSVSDTGSTATGAGGPESADGENPVRRFLKALTGA